MTMLPGAYLVLYHSKIGGSHERSEPSGLLFGDVVAFRARYRWQLALLHALHDLPVASSCDSNYPDPADYRVPIESSFEPVCKQSIRMLEMICEMDRNSKYSSSLPLRRQHT